MYFVTGLGAEIDSLMQAIAIYSLQPLPGQIAVICATSSIAFVMRKVMFNLNVSNKKRWVRRSLYPFSQLLIIFSYKLLKLLQFFDSAQELVGHKIPNGYDSRQF